MGWDRDPAREAAGRELGVPAPDTHSPKVLLPALAAWPEVPQAGRA
ncbi:hypothetical protein Sgou_01740 [Streptomyces gougerotii]|uniref:Uncharacterized protein n=1 Tax=Streptomyces gougerotii TaxID=53448 RepID=A0A8H9I0M1_9ACTN|nr:hypothetical protein Sgou_01740 [Streptomyces gougerotii]GGU93248.1 hypothetical protein GCM10010227_55710 [Streptomyces gougerotii]